MDSPEILIAFGAVMLVIALLAVAIDWFGKPMRHRKFVPKIYRFPDERQPRRSQVRETEWSDTAFVLPVVEPPVPEMLVRYPDPRLGAQQVGAAPSALERSPVDVGPPTAQVPPVALHDEGDEATTGAFAPFDLAAEDSGSTLGLVTLEDRLGSDAAGLLQPDGTVAGGDLTAPPSDDRAEDADHPDDDPATSPGGWAQGDSVFVPTANGEMPSKATVRSRYWKNVAGTAGVTMFGDANADRMAAGKPPERRNPRTGRVEVMRLPGVEVASDAETPVPEWPGSALDPYGD